MQRHGIPGFGVDALDDVDLAALGPVRTQKPESWPHAADTGGHVGDVGNKETVIVGLLGLHADAGTARGGYLVRVVDAEVDGFRVHAHEPVGDRRGVVNVLDETPGWVIVGEVGEFGDEVGGGEAVGEGVTRSDNLG